MNIVVFSSLFQWLSSLYEAQGAEPSHAPYSASGSYRDRRTGSFEDVRTGAGTAGPLRSRSGSRSSTSQTNHIRNSLRKLSNV